LSGSADNPAWGKGALRGNYDRDANAVRLDVRTEQPVAVTQAMLTALPFVPASVWREVQLQGVTPVELTLGYDLSKKALPYRVALNPRAPRGRVAAIELDGTHARGQVVIEDGLVRLRGVQGVAFGGRLRTDADLDFRGPETRLGFDPITAEDLDVARLPKSWK